MNKSYLERKDNENYCGTHIKGVPHGVVNLNESNVVSHKEVWCEDIGGILQYIDTDGNIYKHEEVMNNVVNPSIIGKYEISRSRSLNFAMLIL